MKTSYFAKSARHPNAVSISRYPPKWYSGRTYPQLAPPGWFWSRELSNEEYKALYYQHVLSRLDPHQVYEELGDDAILLCFERPGAFCHRRLVAKWLEISLGVEIPELGYEDVDEEEEEREEKQATLFSF